MGAWVVLGRCLGQHWGHQDLIIYIYIFSNINETIEIHKGTIGTTSNIGEVGGCGVTLGKH